jgi:hypothetical protein
LLGSHQRKQLQQYSQSINALNRELGKNTDLYVNNVLSKDPYAGGGLILLLKNKRIPFVPFSRKLLYISKYFATSFAFLVLWISKKILFNLMIPRINIKNIDHLHVVDIFLLSKNIAQSGKFQDRYLSELTKVLRKNNLNYMYLPCFYRDGYNPIIWFKLYRILKKSKHQFISEYDLLTYLDILKIVKFLFRYLFLLLSFIKEHKVESNIDEAIHYSLENSLKDYTLLAYIRYLVGVNLAKNLNNAKLLSYCEYQVVDKSLYKGIKDIDKGFKIYAYQQLRTHEFFMNMKIPEQDKYIGIAPDKIIVNGDYYLPKKTSYKYTALSIRNKEVFYTASDKKSNNCLILLPYNSAYSIYIINSIMESKIINNDFYIKPHPTLDLKILKQHWEYGNIIYGDLYQYIPNANIIITAIGGAALEAVSMGVTVIIIENKNDFNINPLIGLGKGIIWDIVYNGKELNTVYENLLEKRVNNFDEVMDYSKKYRDLFFSKPSDKDILTSFDASNSTK